MLKLPALLLLLALLAGGWLRLAHPGALEMSADEGASWAAAAAPALKEVARLQRQLNPGKLALYEITLHEWIGAFGSSLGAMRRLSGVCGTIAVLLIFLVTRELPGPIPGTGPRPGLSERDAAAAVAAILLAVSLITIKYSRETRMYAMQLALILAQAAMLLRVSRRGGLFFWAALGALTALSFAAGFSSALVFTAEAVWLIGRLLGGRRALSAPAWRGAWMGLFGLVLGGLLVLPFLPAAFAAQRAAMGRGVFRWIARPPLWEPFALFNKGAGTFPFPLLVVLAVWAIYRLWGKGRGAVVFLLLWMWLPVVMLMVFSYTVEPALVERYLLSCFAPFLILAALGIAELPYEPVRAGALVLAVLLALGHVDAHRRKPHGLAWREAARAALLRPNAGLPILVAPAYAVSVVRYYMPREQRARVRPADDPVKGGLLIIGSQGVEPARRAALEREYPAVLAAPRGILLRAPWRPGSRRRCH